MLVCAGLWAVALDFGQYLSRNATSVTAEAALPRSVHHRTRHTVDFQCKLLTDLQALEDRLIPHARTVSLRSHNDVDTTVTRWSLKRNELFAAQTNGFGNELMVQRYSRVAFPQYED